MNDLKKSFLDGVKEFARIFLLGVVSYLLTGGLEAVLKAFVGTRLSPEMYLVIVGMLTTALKSVDEWIHEWGKATDNKTLTKGLTQF